MCLRRCGMAAGEELLDPGQDRVGIGEPGRVVAAVDLEVPRAGDVVGDVAAALYWHGVVAGVDDEGGRGDRRQDRPRSIRNTDSIVARAMPGLALMRSNMAS